MSIVETLVSFDHSLFLFLNTAVANQVFDVIFRNGTEARFWIVPGIAATVLFFVKKRKEAAVVAVCMMVTVAVTDPVTARVLKPLFGRYRPCHPEYFIEGAHFLSGMRHTYSFPSVHAANIAGQAMLLTLFYPGWKWVYISFALFIGYSRIYVGVHYPADVAAGALFGTAVGSVVYLCWFRISIMVKNRRETDTVAEENPV
jgi:undecaprenyl-diphosphatase